MTLKRNFNSKKKLVLKNKRILPDFLERLGAVIFGWKTS